MNTQNTARVSETLTAAEVKTIRAAINARTAEAVAVAARVSMSTLRRAVAGKSVSRTVHDALVRAAAASAGASTPSVAA